MKKNKKRLLISTLVLFVIWSCVTIYIVFNDKKDINEEKVLGFESVTVINNINVSVGENFYVKDEGNKLVIYDFNDNIISEYTEEFTNYEIFDKRFIIVTNKNIKKIINKDGKILINGTQIKVANDNKYVLVDNAVYDNNLNKIYVLDFTGNFEYFAEFGNDLLIIEPYEKESKSIVVDLINKKVLWRNFENSSLYNNDKGMTYFRFTKNNKGYLIDTRTKEVLYEGITYDNTNYIEYNIFTYNNIIYYIDGDKIYKDNTKINNKYKMSKDKCQTGYKLKDNNDKIVVDKCMYAYKILFDDAILGIDTDNYILFYKDKEISGGEITLEGDYIKVAAVFDLLGDGTTYKYYDKSLKQLNINENINISYLTNNVYSGYDYQSFKYYFLDKNLNEIAKDFYNINCYNNGYCDVFKNVNEHYLYKDGKEIIDEIFVNIKINDEHIILETLYKTYIIKLGNNKIKKINFNFDYDINLDDIIDKYDLEKIELKINKNEELFKKYAYIVENNDMLLDYKKEVYDIFEIVVDKKEYLDEFYFLHKLGYLNINKADILQDGKAFGTYQDFDTRIDLVTDKDSVLYHELIHFVDFSFNNKQSTTLYRCDNKVDVYDAILNIPDNCEYVSFTYTNYITEAGAEIFTSKYFTKNVSAYSFGTYYLEALEYIYGSSALNKWYYDDTNYFVKVLYDGFNDEKIVMNVLNALSDTTSLDVTYKHTGYLLDVLIDLYKKNIKEDYLSDKKFVFLLKPLLGFMNADNSKYYKELNNYDYELNFLDNLKKDINYDYYNYYLEPIIINDKMYLSWYVWNLSGTKNAIIWIDYDFDKGDVKDFKILEE